MSKKSVAKNYIYNVIYQFLAMIIPLVTTPYLSRILGSQKIGIYSYTVSITTYFVLLGSIGVSLYGQKEIAYVQDDKLKYSKKFFEIFIMKFITSMISLVFYYYFLIRNNIYSEFYLILVLDIFASVVDISWFFQGIEEFKKTILRNTIIKILSLIAIFIFVKDKEDLNIYFWIYVLSNFIGNLSLWPYLFNFIVKVDIKTLKIFNHLKPCILLFIPQIATQLYTVLDKTMIGFFSSDISQVAYYEQVQKIIKMLLMFITSLGTVMLPRVSSYFAQNNITQIKKSLLISFNYVLCFSIPLMFGIIVTSDKLIPLFLGDGFVESINIMKIMSLIVVFISLSNVIGIQYLLPTKKEKQFTFAVLIGAFSNVLLNLVLIRTYDALGATVATVLSELFVLLAMMYFTRNDFNYKNILLTGIKYFSFGIIMYLCCSLVPYRFNSIISIILRVSVGIIVYFSLLILFKDQLVELFFKKIKLYKK